MYGRRSFICNCSIDLVYKIVMVEKRVSSSYQKQQTFHWKTFGIVVAKVRGLMFSRCTIQKAKKNSMINRGELQNKIVSNKNEV